MEAFKTPKLTVEAYLQRELESGVKHEFHDGKIYALAGGTINHGRLCGNIYSEIRSGLKQKKSDCEVLNGEVKLHIEKTNTYVYPDAMVVCGAIETAENNENAVTNPILVVEVLSKSTADYDRGEKFYIYRQIPSLQEYILIEQDQAVVEVYYKKEGSDLWSINRYQKEKLVKLESIGIEVALKDLYDNVDV